MLCKSALIHSRATSGTFSLSALSVSARPHGFVTFQHLSPDKVQALRKLGQNCLSVSRVHYM